MPIEYERKFLVNSEAWKSEVVGQKTLEQGYVSTADIASVRARLTNGAGWLTIKSEQVGDGRPEWEYPIPEADARELIELAPSTVVKTRHDLNRGPHQWTIDVFEGENHGLVLLEVESARPISRKLKLPAWVGKEVTNDPRYKNSYLSRHPFATWGSTAETPTRLRDAHVRMEDESRRSKEGWRSDAHTDIDRIWYAPEFRRLGGVTQVVPPQNEYIFHDRLMHSIKVAQVAATLARMHLQRVRSHRDLREELRDASLDIHDWINPDYCYAAGLAHDIGHPPYGHAGEAALQELHETKQLFANNGSRSFEGNAQSTRIVAHLSFRKLEQDGLNLTLRTLAAVAKYPWLREHHPHEITKLSQKWSFYGGEKSILEALERHGFIATVRGSGSKKPIKGRANNNVVEKVYRWPEAELMDWADDISYAVHDVEDFFRAGRIPLDRIAAALRRAVPDSSEGTESQSIKKATPGPPAIDWAATDFDFANPDEEIREALLYARSKMATQLDQDGNPIGDSIPLAFAQIAKELLVRMPGTRFNGTFGMHASLQNFGSKAITYLSKSTRLDVLKVGVDWRVRFRVLPEAQLVAEFFKAICKYFVINTSAVASMQAGQKSSLKRLAEALYRQAETWRDRDHAGPDVHTLPARLKENLHLREQSEGAPVSDEQLMETVVDYVCGLRDVQARILESRLFGDASSLNVDSDWLGG